MHGKQLALQGSGQKWVPKGSEFSPAASSSFTTTCLSCHSTQIFPAAKQPRNADAECKDLGQRAPKAGTGAITSPLPNRFRNRGRDQTLLRVPVLQLPASPPCSSPAPPPPPGSQADAKPGKLFFHLQHLAPWQTLRAIMFIALKLPLALLRGFAALGL